MQARVLNGIAGTLMGGIIGVALRHQQKGRYQLLLEWLQEQFAKGHSIDEVEAILAA